MWNIMKLGDVCTISSSKRIFAKEYQNVGIPFYRGKEIIEKNKGNDVTTELFISPERYEEIKNKYDIPRKGDILLTSVGTLGVPWLVDEEKFYFKDGNLTWLRPKDRIVSEYLYYWLNSEEAQNQIDAKCIGSTQKALTIETLNKFQISLPSIDVQRKIVAMIRPIEEKINANRKVNKNLEQQAQALFKSWFLDYEPWDGSVPDSWNSGKLGNFVEIKRGGSPRPIQEYLSDSGLRWLKISDVTSLQTPFVIDIKDHIIEAGLRKTVFLKAGSLVLSNSATPGVPKIIDVDSCIHDGWLYFPESKFSKEYLYLYFKYIRQQLVNLSNGSVFNNLKTDILKGYPTKLPDKETLQRFDNIVKPMFLQMQNLTRESHKLVDMRNALLPKLISGELDVSNLDL